MDGMTMLPLVEGCQHQYTQHQPEPIICLHGPEERTVTAVMEDDETPHHESASWDGKEQRQPVAYCEAAVHEIPHHDERNN